MKNLVKLSAINASCHDLPIEANPYGKVFDPAAARMYVESNVEKMFGFLHEAGRNGSDLVTTYEDFKGVDPYFRYMANKEIFLSLTEEIPGPTSERIGEIARQYQMYIAANYYEKDGNDIYNSTILVGRDGKLIGKYRKVHLPVSEKWRVSGGKDFPVFETDIGRLGIAVCYDIVFTEHCRTLALNGADIIIHPTAGMGINCVSSPELGEALLRVRAAENAVYLLVAKNITHGGSGKSCVVNNAGEIIGKSAGADEGIAVAAFTPDYDIDRKWMFDTLFSGVSSVKARHFLEREPSLYSRITSATPPLMERYQGVELQLNPGKVQEISEQWKEYVQAHLENRPPTTNYHW